MADEWYYADKGESVGPLSTEEVTRRIKQTADATHLVWSEGLPGWKEAHTLPQFASALRVEPPARPNPVRAALEASRVEANQATTSQATTSQTGAKESEAGVHQSLAQRARHELIAYLAISAYLFVWFAALMFYKATILRSVGVEFAPFGLAIVKALILGKFILVLEALKIGDRQQGGALIVLILKKALLFTLLLFVLTVIEEVVVGYFHGREARQALSEMGGGTLPQAFATGVLMFLVLVPYLGFRRIAQAHGDLPEFLFTRPPPSK
jgi:hypothetical protein